MSLRAISVALVFVVVFSSWGCSCSASSQVKDSTAGLQINQTDGARAGTGGGAESDGSAPDLAANESETNGKVGINPGSERVALGGLSELNSMGVKMTLPSQGSEFSYYAIAGRIAGMEFTVIDTRFDYRASTDATMTSKQLSGMYEDLGEAIAYPAMRGSESASVLVYVAPSGILCATWEWSEARYSLTAQGSIPQGDFSNLALEIAQD